MTMSEFEFLKEFKNDEVYKPFLTEDFDVKLVTSAAVQLVAVTEHLAKLSAGITLLDEELHTQVVNHYKDLLSQATEIETLEVILQNIHSKIEAVLTSAKRLCKTVTEPYEAVSDQTVTLSRLQTTCDILRRIIRIMSLCRKLEKLINTDSMEFVQSSQCINELDYLTDGVDLSGISIVENDLCLIKHAKKVIHAQAKVLLLKGMESKNDLDVAIALEAFHNLQLLRPTLEKIFQQFETKILQASKNALNINPLTTQSSDEIHKGYGPGRAAAIAPSISNFRQTLWENMEALTKQILTSFEQAVHLHNVLSKKRDKINGTCFADDMKLVEIQCLIKKMWQAVTKGLTNDFAQAANDTPLIKQEFEEEFSKLLFMVNKLFTDLQYQGVFCIIDEYNNSYMNVIDNCGFSGFPQDLLRNALSPFENAYLSRCFSRLTDSVNVAFTGEGRIAPTVTDIEGIINIMKSELGAASVDPLLLMNIMKNVGDSVIFIVEKCQYLICVDETAAQIIDVPNSHQILNAQVIHLLHLLQTELENLFTQNVFNKEAKDVIQGSLESVISLMNIIVEPLFLAISSAIEAIIVTMHKEDFSIDTSYNSGKILDGQCSLYMRELQHFIMRVQNDYFSLYPDCLLVIKGIQDLASHAIELFIRHVSLVRPLKDGGRMRLAADCAQMEMAVTPFCQRVGDLGKSYRLLRSFRPLLFQTPDHIMLSPSVGDIIPYSIAIHLLFTRAPAELQSPHMSVGWSVDEYSHWLETHKSEKERLIFIRGALEKYVKWIKQKQGKEFCEVYPVIFDMLQSGLKVT